MSLEAFSRKSEGAAGIQEGKFIEDALLKDLDREEKRDYKPYKEAVEYVKEHQIPVDFAKPETLPHKSISELKSAINDKLWQKLGDKIGDEKLKFYSAKGSILDKKHGVDAFFTLGENNMVTIDLTLNTSKITHKADVVMQLDDVEGMTSEIIDHYSDDIVDIFVEKIQSRD